jgi:hypothetical protein
MSPSLGAAGCLRRHGDLSLPHLAAAALLLCSLIGCGYRQAGSYEGQPEPGYKWHSLYREDVHSVAVPIFTNRDFTKGIEFSLTSAIVKDVEAYTPYKVINRDRADTILEGEIVAVRVSTISRDPKTTLPQEQLVTLTVNFLWKDLRNGRILVERKGFEQSTTFFPTLGEGQFVGNEEGIERLALGIVEELHAEW